MNKQEILMLVGFLLMAISGMLFLWSWPLLAQGLDGGLHIFIAASLVGVTGGVLWMVATYHGE